MTESKATSPRDTLEAVRELNGQDVLSFLEDVESAISFYVRHMGGLKPGQEMGFAARVSDATGWSREMGHRFVDAVVAEYRDAQFAQEESV